MLAAFDALLPERTRLPLSRSFFHRLAYGLLLSTGSSAEDAGSEGDPRSKLFRARGAGFLPQPS
jgi:hypothetical protein